MDNLFVVVQEFDQYQFKESKVNKNIIILIRMHNCWNNMNCVYKEETLAELQQLASKLPWNDALEVWKLNRTLKKKKGHRRGGNKVKPTDEAQDATEAENKQQELPETLSAAEDQPNVESTTPAEGSTADLEDTVPEAKVIKFRVTCSRAGDKHSFSSNEAARDFGGAVQEFFQWKADMTKFDIEVGGPF